MAWGYSSTNNEMTSDVTETVLLTLFAKYVNDNFVLNFSKYSMNNIYF